MWKRGKLLFYSASRRQSLDDDTSADSPDAPRENIFHFDASFAEKQLPKYKNLSAIVADSSDVTDGLEYPEKYIRNFIVNKLYNDLGTENNNSKLFALSKPSICNNSRNYRVEIDANAKPKTKCTIKIQDCECRPNDVATNKLNKLLFVENRGYGVAMPTQNDIRINGEPVEQMRNGASKNEAKATKARILTSIDLLNFARQIAFGMVMN